MHPVFVLLKKECLLFLRNKAAVSLTFVVPIVLIYLFGHVFGLYRKETGPTGIRVAVVNESQEPAAADLIQALQGEKAFRILTTRTLSDGTTVPLDEEAVRAGLRQNEYRYAMIIPADMISPERLGIRFKFLSDPRNDIEAQTVNGLLQKTIFMRVPQLLGQSLQSRARGFIGAERLTAFNRSLAKLYGTTFGWDEEELFQRLQAGDVVSVSPRQAPGAENADPALRRLDTPRPDEAAPASRSEPEEENSVLSRIIQIETEQVAGKQTANPMAARLVGGYAIMFLLFAVSGSAANLFQERRSGIFARLLAAPVSPSHILWSRFLFGIVLGLFQLTALFSAGSFFYKMDVLSHLVPLFAVAVAASAACTAFGMFVAAVAPSPEAATGIGTLIIMTMSAIGGAWFPVTFMPEFIQQLSKLTIVYWSVEGFTSVLWAGQSLADLIPTVAVLGGIALGVMLFSTWMFRRRKMFD